MAENFQTVQLVILFAFVAIGFMTVRSRTQKSNFKVREADRDWQSNSAATTPSSSANPPPPLALPGIRLNGEPHEVLGVRAYATEDEINRAFKELMKKYHPDVIQNGSSEQLKFYQEAATQINRAKEKMIQDRRKKH